MRNIDHVNHRNGGLKSFHSKNNDNALLKGNNLNEAQFDLEDKNEPTLYSDIK
jgi:hypothetical protein